MFRTGECVIERRSRERVCVYVLTEWNVRVKNAIKSIQVSILKNIKFCFSIFKIIKIITGVANIKIFIVYGI